MKFKNFGYNPKNRKVYCYNNSTYVNFNDVVDYIRLGFKIGLFNIGEDLDQQKALIKGNKYVIQGFAKHIDTFSDSTIHILTATLYDTWNLNKKEDLCTGH